MGRNAGAALAPLHRTTCPYCKIAQRVTPLGIIAIHPGKDGKGKPAAICKGSTLTPKP